MPEEIMAKGYEPKDVEDKWYEYWLKEELFKAEVPSDKKPFCIVIPPPNVTGTLHMGHALNNTLQDVLCRYKKMKGFNVLWQPGTDHAGIATQNVVEKELMKKKISRHDVGREKFIELVWEWREKYGGLIINQLKKLGSSCDWSRERFTMDEGLSRAVKEVFVRLYEEGLIYRGDYIINWCPRCHTAIADIEVEHEDRDSFLYHLKYRFENSDKYLVVATTRPETLLGDTAVAVNPEDERYMNLPGKYVLLPVTGKAIPVILDRYVDKEFGTGALKVTPAHDPNDFNIGNKHGLERVKVIDEDGRMNELAGKYKGMDRFECREAILTDLEKDGLLEKKEPYKNATGHCYRCKTMIEPLLSKQWFVKTEPLAKKAIEAVASGKTRILPKTWENVYFDWMNNIRDWCISRQIWWGHRIPAWYCDKCGNMIVAKDEPKTCPSCGNTELRQETDVLDTWFSSALWPFSTLGWPDNTEALKMFYPTSALVTGFDILFFWVARMMMMGLHFMGDTPFSDVYIHALVRDAEGKKMSKSKGNVIDPLIVIDQYGTDAFRFTLAAFAAQGRDIKLSEERIEGYRHFINKIWNSARLVLSNLKGDEKDGADTVLSLPDRWILARLGEVGRDVSIALEEYRYNDAAGIAYQFVWHEFCDWYLEMAKEWLYSEDEQLSLSVRCTLVKLLSGIMRILHPFMPFITEEIWQRLPGTSDSIMKASFPVQADYPVDDAAIKEMAFVMGVINSIRNVRGEMNIHPSKKVDIHVSMPDDTQRKVISANINYIKNLARVEHIRLEKELVKPDASATAVYEGNNIHILLKGIIDVGEEKARINKEIAKIKKEMDISEKKLSNSGFLANAPDDVVVKVKEKVALLSNQLNKLMESLAFFEGIDA
ncbi:MAG: valine--tRNA ligase [Deltaproteobacteria bacterium]|nr:valine--tRNA ligase [Deltaproteobacteria bacterium]